MNSETVGDFQIVRKIGEGHTADVFLAIQLNDGKHVALKFCKQGEDQAEWLRQLRNEASLMPQLRSEVIPEFYGYYESDGRFYNVLEYIDGCNLHNYFENRESLLKEHPAINWGLRICRVLDLLHNHQPDALVSAGIVPRNLMLDQNNNIYVIDFGKVEAHSINRVHPRIGKIGYSAPEQYEGYREPRSDLYSLGVLLYHATTGLDPGKEDPENFDYFRKNPPRNVNDGLSNNFEALILKAVEKRPEKRFQTAREMEEELKNCK